MGADRSDLDSLHLSGLLVGSDVRLGVGSWESVGSAEMLLGLSVLGCSEEQGVGSFN